MSKRSSANHSLWPEQARPRRGLPLSLAAGGFAVGAICAIAVVNVAFQYVPPMAMEPEPMQNAETVRPIPVYLGSSTLVAGKPPPASEEQSPTYGRPRTVAKVALPTIGRAVPVASQTDGRADDATAKMPPVRLSGVPAATAVASPKLIRNDIKAARKEKPSLPEQPSTQLAAREPAPEASAAPQEPTPEVQPTRTARPEPRATSQSRVKRQAERSRVRAREERPRDRFRPSYAARYRAGPVYGANGAPISGSFSN